MVQFIYLQISIIYDSESRPGSKMKPGWGFSAIIERGDFVVMLDTGLDEETFKHNLRISGYKPTDIDVVAISHWHPDHTGGLRYLMEANPNLIAYVPASTAHQPPVDKRYIVLKGKKDLPNGLVVLQTTAVDSEKSTIFVFGGLLVLNPDSTSPGGPPTSLDKRLSGLYEYHVPTNTWKKRRDDESAANAASNASDLRLRSSHTMLFHKASR